MTDATPFAPTPTRRTHATTGGTTASLDATFTANLKALRGRKQLTQTELARKAKVSTSYISMLERGQRSPPLETIEKLADALGVKPVAMLT